MRTVQTNPLTPVGHGLGPLPLPSIEPSIELPLSLGAVIWSSLKTGLRFLLSEV
jgi:hypothetical protein